MVRRYLRSNPSNPVGQIVVLAACALLSTAAHGRTWVRISPNALQQRETPMQVEVANIDATDTVSFEVRADCGRERSSCRQHPLTIPGSWREGAYHAVVDLSETSGIPADEPLHLWTTIVQGDRSTTHATLFSVKSNHCGLLRTVWQMFASGTCQPNFGRALIGAQFGSSEPGSEDKQLRIGVLKDNDSSYLRGTERVTGVAWRDSEWLLFTSTGPKRGNGAGLYEVLPTGSSRTQLFLVQDGAPVAPFALRSGAVGALIRRVDDRWEAWVQDPPAAAAAPNGSQPRRIPLSSALGESVQVLATTPSGLLVHFQRDTEVLAVIDLLSGAVVELPFDRGLAIRSRARYGKYHPVEHTDSGSTSEGINISGLSSQGTLTKQFLVAGVGDDRLPVASPDGTRLAWVSESTRP